MPLLKPEEFFANQEIWERQHAYVPPREYIVDTHVDALKNIVIDGLRDIFLKHQAFQYVPREDNIPGPDLCKTGIVITDVYNYETRFLPVITVRVNTSNTHHISFNQNVGTEGYLMDENGNLTKDSYGRPIPIFYEYAGAWDSSVTLNVSAESTIEREELVTFCSVVAINLLRDYWRFEGMFVKNVTVGGESEAPFANDYIFQQSVTLDVYSEWTRRIPVPEGILEGINYQMNVTDADDSSDTKTETDLVTPAFTIENAIFWNGASWQVKTLYRDFLADRLVLSETIVLMDELIARVNTLKGSPVYTHSLTSFDTINVNDFFLLMVHVNDALRLETHDLLSKLDTYISTLVDSAQIVLLTASRNRLDDIERTLVGDTVDVGVGYVPRGSHN